MIEHLQKHMALKLAPLEAMHRDLRIPMINLKAKFQVQDNILTKLEVPKLMKTIKSHINLVKWEIKIDLILHKMYFSNQQLKDSLTMMHKIQMLS